MVVVPGDGSTRFKDFGGNDFMWIAGKIQGLRRRRDECTLPKIDQTGPFYLIFNSFGKIRYIGCGKTNGKWACVGCRGEVCSSSSSSRSVE